MPEIHLLQQGSGLGAAQGVIGFCTVVLIEGEKRTLVDTGHVGRRLGLQKALRDHGLTEADIDVTVMSHAHWDHAQNFDLFDHAPMLIHDWERRYIGRPHGNDWATPAWTQAMVERQPKIEVVEDGYEIEPGVRVVHTPGHSAGHVSVMVDTDEGVCAVTGDALHSGSAALRKRNPRVFWDEEQAAKSIERVVQEADILYPGHDRPFRIVDGEIDYLRPLSIHLRGVQRDDPGLTFETKPRELWVMEGVEEQTLERLGL